MASQQQTLTMKQLTISKMDVTYTIWVTSEMYDRCQEDGNFPDVLFATINSIGKFQIATGQRSLDCTESLEVLAGMGLLKDIFHQARNPTGITIGMSAIFDETSKNSFDAYNQGIITDDDLFTLARLTPRSMTSREKVRAMEIMTASAIAADHVKPSTSAQCSGGPTPQPVRIQCSGGPTPQPARTQGSDGPPPQPARIQCSGGPTPQPARTQGSNGPPPQPARTQGSGGPTPQPARTQGSGGPTPQPARTQCLPTGSTDSEEPRGSSSLEQPDRSTESCRSLFNRQQTLMLLDLYSDRKQRFDSLGHKKKLLWEELTSDLNNRLGTNFNAQQVEGRWKTLVAAYKRHKKDQNTTGRDKKDFEYESQMDDLLGNRHDVVPVAILTSLPGRSEEESSSSTDQGAATPPSTPSPSSSKGTKRKRQSSGPSSVLEFLKDYTEEQKKMKEEKRKDAKDMHEQKMAMFKLMIESMKK